MTRKHAAIGSALFTLLLIWAFVALHNRDMSVSGDAEPDSPPADGTEGEDGTPALTSMIYGRYLIVLSTDSFGDSFRSMEEYREDGYRITVLQDDSVYRIRPMHCDENPYAHSNIYMEQAGGFDREIWVWSDSRVAVWIDPAAGSLLPVQYRFPQNYTLQEVRYNPDQELFSAIYRTGENPSGATVHFQALEADGSLVADVELGFYEGYYIPRLLYCDRDGIYGDTKDSSFYIDFATGERTELAEERLIMLGGHILSYNCAWDSAYDATAYTFTLRGGAAEDSGTSVTATISDTDFKLCLQDDLWAPGVVAFDEEGQTVTLTDGKLHCTIDFLSGTWSVERHYTEEMFLTDTPSCVSADGRYEVYYASLTDANDCDVVLRDTQTGEIGFLLRQEYWNTGAMSFGAAGQVVVSDTCAMRFFDAATLEETAAPARLDPPNAVINGIGCDAGSGLYIVAATVPPDEDYHLMEDDPLPVVLYAMTDRGEIVGSQETDFRIQSYSTPHTATRVAVLPGDGGVEITWNEKTSVFPFPG